MMEYMNRWIKQGFVMKVDPAGEVRVFDVHKNAFVEKANLFNTLVRRNMKQPER